jgi:hypothetical protein
MDISLSLHEYWSKVLKRERTSLLWEYNHSVPFFFLAGPSLKVLKSIPLQRVWANEAVLTIRTLTSGLILAVARRVGKRSFVK